MAPSVRSLIVLMPFASGLHVVPATGSIATSASRVSTARMSATSPHLGRRSVTFLAVAAHPWSQLIHAANAEGDATGKVVIFGGSGYVGAYASQMLLQKGYEVVSVSRKSEAEQAEKVRAILGTGLSKVDYRSLDASSADLSGVLKGASAVISCVGIAPGGTNQRDGNGKVNVRIADAVKAAGIERFVYLGVASELSNGPIKFLFGDYVKGKAEATAAVTKDFGQAALIVNPGIIAGAPPGEIRPPGPPGMAPVPVEAVAKAAVAGAIGLKSGTIDGNDSIVAVAAAL